MSCKALTRHAPGERLPRHRHIEGYAALVLSGGYVEAGDRGRFAVEAGHVVMHGPFEAHCDDFSATGAVVLNLPMTCHASGLARIADPDSIVRMAERAMREACEALAANLVESCSGLDDWVDQLRVSLTEDPNLKLGEWADRAMIARPSISRGFRRAYGVTPKRFRADQRALRAVRALSAWRGTGAELAAEMGYADQSHMTRSIVGISGLCPSQLR